ncbi:MAG: hypothetical protein WC875_04005 [Candidatus Absconditabacterales bacterium]
MLKILVTYYSRSGTTRKLAESIALQIKADSEEIIDTKKRSGICGYILAGKDAALKRFTKIQTPTKDPATYDMVMIGTPVRDFTMATAIRTYLEEYKEKLPKELVFFCTLASKGAESTFQDMANVCGKKPIGIISFLSKEITKNTYQEKLSEFLKSLGLISTL